MGRRRAPHGIQEAPWQWSVHPCPVRLHHPQQRQSPILLGGNLQKQLLWQAGNANVGATASHHKDQLWPGLSLLWAHCQGHQHLQAERGQRDGRMQLLQIRQPNGQLRQQDKGVHPAANKGGCSQHNKHASNVQTKEKLMTMEVEIKKLTATIAVMAASMTNNKNQDPNGSTNGGGGSNCTTRRPQMTKICNMGAYCSLHGFHPVGAHHDSTKLHLEEAQAQQHRHLEQPPWRRQVLAKCQASGNQATRSSHMEGKVSPHQLTGTGECIEQNKR